jgi:hypothetical protein
MPHEREERRVFQDQTSLSETHGRESGGISLPKSYNTIFYSPAEAGKAVRRKGHDQRTTTGGNN